MKLLLVETTQYAPASPLFLEAAASLPDVTVALFDERPYFAAIATSLAHRAVFRALGRRPLRLLSFERALIARAEQLRPDVILIVKGPFVRAAALRRLRRTGARLVNFSTDDPFNPLAATRYMQPAIGEYDLYATPRTANVAQLRACGARQTAVVPFGYKPTVHFADPADAAAGEGCDLLFIGGADHDRVAFFRRVVQRWPEVRMDLYGGYWNRDAVLRRYWRGFAIGEAYRVATRQARFAVNLVRRANRDTHVMRTFEVPACGGCMLAERTADHEQFFEDGREAILFTTPDELVERARTLHADRDRRHAIAAAGRARVIRDGHTYADRLKILLQACQTN
jgi:hypothetical protein